MVHSSPQDYLIVYSLLNIRREVHVLIGESGHASSVKTERVNKIISDVGLFHDLEVAVNHVVNIFELSALNEESQEELAVLLEAVIGLMKQFILSVVLSALLPVRDFHILYQILVRGTRIFLFVVL